MSYLLDLFKLTTRKNTKEKFIMCSGFKQYQQTRIRSCIETCKWTQKWAHINQHFHSDIKRQFFLQVLWKRRLVMRFWGPPFCDRISAVNVSNASVWKPLRSTKTNSGNELISTVPSIDLTTLETVDDCRGSKVFMGWRGQSLVGPAAQMGTNINNAKG